MMMIENNILLLFGWFFAIFGRGVNKDIIEIMISHTFIVLCWLWYYTHFKLLSVYYKRKKQDRKRTSMVDSLLVCIYWDMGFFGTLPRATIVHPSIYCWILQLVWMVRNWSGVKDIEGLICSCNGHNIEDGLWFDCILNCSVKI